MIFTYFVTTVIDNNWRKLINDTDSVLCQSVWNCTRGTAAINTTKLANCTTVHHAYWCQLNCRSDICNLAFLDLAAMNFTNTYNGGSLFSIDSSTVNSKYEYTLEAVGSEGWEENILNNSISVQIQNLLDWQCDTLLASKPHNYFSQEQFTLRTYTKCGCTCTHSFSSRSFSIGSHEYNNTGAGRIGPLLNRPSANRPPKNVGSGQIGPLKFRPWTNRPPVENFCN